jgi:hemoglobin/transferrin/lactoferrin receptor protein
VRRAVCGYAIVAMLLLPALFAVFSFTLSALAPPVGGRVIDARTGAPIAGADVTVVGQRGSVRTDGAGRFEWPAAPPLPIDLVVVLPDGRIVKRIRLTTIDTANELTLAVEPLVMEQIAVTGTAPTIEGAPAAAMTLIAGADLERRHPQTLAQALETIPGVGAISEGQAAAPAIRGLARGRTLIVVDGSRASTERRAGPNASFLDPAAVRMIEVARGPGSVAYGSDALGGVIAARTRGPDYRAPLRVRFAASAGGGVPEQRGDLEISTGYGSGGVLLGIRVREFHDYDAPGGRVPNSRWRDQGVRARWEHAARTTRWSAGWQTDFGRDLGRPRSDGDVVRATSPLEDSHRLTVSYERGSAGVFETIRVDALAATSRQRTDQDRLPTPTRARSVERADLSSREMQLRLSGERRAGRAEFRVGADMHGRYGFEALDTTISYNLAGIVTSTAVTASVASANRTALGLFAETAAQVTKQVRFTGGLRVDGVRSRNEGGFFGDRTVSSSAVAGLIAVTIAPADGLTVTAQLARGFRDPILSDRFYRGPVGRGFIEGNPALKPETSLQVDVLTQYVVGQVRIAASAYRYRINDLVERYASTSTLFLYRNRGRADVRGLEVEAQLTLPRGFAIEGTGEVSRGRDAVDRTPLDDIAPAAVSLTIRSAVDVRVSSYLRLKAIAAHPASGPSEVPTSSFTLVEAGVRWRLTPHLDLLGVARNLLNAAYQSSAGPRWVWAPGRHGAATIVARF